MTRLCLSCRRQFDDKGSRCESCERERKRARDLHRAPAKRLRYNANYRRIRAEWAVVVAQHGYVCARGGERQMAGAPFHLDHLNSGLAPSCPAHNQANTPEKGNG